MTAAVRSRKLSVVKTLGERLRELRDGKDLSLRELARKLGRSPAHLSDIELGRRYPSPEVLAELARALEVSVGDLQQYDARPPLDELKRRSEREPALGFALRRMIDEGMSGKELMDILDKKAKKK